MCCLSYLLGVNEQLGSCFTDPPEARNCAVASSIIERLAALTSSGSVGASSSFSGGRVVIMGGIVA